MYPGLHLKLCMALGQEDSGYCHLQMLCSGATTKIWCVHCFVRTQVCHNCLKKVVAILWADL